MILTDLIIIQFLWVFISDFSGFTEDALKPLFRKWFGIGQPSKIVSCSLCQTWWTGLLYLIITGHFTFPYVAAVAALAALTPVTLDMMHLAKDLLTGAITLIYRIFGI